MKTGFLRSLLRIFLSVDGYQKAGSSIEQEVKVFEQLGGWVVQDNEECRIHFF